MPRQNKQNQTPKAARRGVTLVEIAIVLVIIGLLLGGVLKGQELINNAKIRNIADRQSSLKIAWYSFFDKYQALPGDYVLAEQNIPGAGKSLNHPVGDGIIAEDESPIVLQNLTGAGFLRCPQCTAAGDAQPSAANSLQNNYGGIIGIFTNNILIEANVPVQTYAVRGDAVGGPRLMTHSGARIPSNIAAEVDRKIDDGVANEGDVVFNTWDPLVGGGVALVPPLACMTKNAVQQEDAMSLDFPNQLWWRHADSPVQQNCGFSVKI